LHSTLARAGTPVGPARLGVGICKSSRSISSQICRLHLCWDAPWVCHSYHCAEWCTFRILMHCHRSRRCKRGKAKSLPFFVELVLIDIQIMYLFSVSGLSGLSGLSAALYPESNDAPQLSSILVSPSSAPRLDPRSLIATGEGRSPVFFQTKSPNGTSTARTFVEVFRLENTLKTTLEPHTRKPSTL